MIRSWIRSWITLCYDQVLDLKYHFPAAVMDNTLNTELHSCLPFCHTRYGQYVCCYFCSVAGRWLNNPDVRIAIHAAPVDQIGQWSLCSDKVCAFSTE